MPLSIRSDLNALSALRVGRKTVKGLSVWPNRACIVAAGCPDACGALWGMPQSCRDAEHALFSRTMLCNLLYF